MRHKQWASASMQRYADAMNWFEMRDRQMARANESRREYINRAARAVNSGQDIGYVLKLGSDYRGEAQVRVTWARRMHRSGMRALSEARKYRYTEPVL